MNDWETILWIKRSLLKVEISFGDVLEILIQRSNCFVLSINPTIISIFSKKVLLPQKNSYSPASLLYIILYCRSKIAHLSHKILGFQILQVLTWLSTLKSWAPCSLRLKHSLGLGDGLIFRNLARLFVFVFTIHSYFQHEYLKWKTPSAGFLLELVRLVHLHPSNVSHECMHPFMYRADTLITTFMSNLSFKWSKLHPSI